MRALGEEIFVGFKVHIAAAGNDRDCLSFCIELSAECRRESDGTTRFQHQRKVIHSRQPGSSGIAIAPCSRL